MSLLRHHVVLLDQNEPTEQPIVGRPLRVRPSDGDVLGDGRQRWWVGVDLSRAGEGSVSAVVSTSFDGVLWYPVLALTPRRGPDLAALIELPAFAPLIRAETRGGNVIPWHRVVLRLASDGPFVAAPA